MHASFLFKSNAWHNMPLSLILIPNAFIWFPIQTQVSGVPAKKRRNSLNVHMLRKSKAFACTKGGESRSSPFGNPHRARLAGTAAQVSCKLE